MAELTFCIPIGPAHDTVAQRAIDSAASQSIQCEVLTLHDTDGRGPGWARNRMLEQVDTEFVSFLDADDWIEPAFAEQTIYEFRRIGSGKYIFTDWTNDHGLIVQSPLYRPDKDGDSIPKPGAKPYCGGTWHAITTLIPTAWVRAVGGFDETLIAVEDTDFYMKLCTTMHCAHHLAKPLFHYSANGGRAAAVQGTAHLDAIMRDLSTRYGGKMGCCGQDDDKPMLPVGVKQPGDILAMALWQGNQSKHGLATGRYYPRMSMPKTAWVDPRDAVKNPEWWKIIDVPKVDTPQGITRLEQMAAGAMAQVVKSPYAPPQNEPPVPPVNATPNVARVVRLGAKAVGLPVKEAPTVTEVQWAAAKSAAAGVTNVPHFNDGKTTTDPIFVFSEKPYPSYNDVRRLVELSGFKAVTPKEMDFFSKQPYIIISPEPLGVDFADWRARVICWQLEYAGDYTHNYDGFKGEIWASDKVWSDANKAKYVLMGSHPGLAGEHNGEADYLYDVTMLAYMTPRRAAIKEQLKDLRWPADYPGHGTADRNAMLWDTRLMLHVHQHEAAPFVAPQRFAIAAAYKMPVVSETTPGLGELWNHVTTADYTEFSQVVRQELERLEPHEPEPLHELLCVESPFRRCVEEALK